MRIGEEQRGQTDGLSLFASQPAAAYEIDLVDFSDEPGPGGAAGGFGHSAGGWLRARVITLHTVCLPPPCRGVADDVSPLGPLPAAAGGVQTKISDKANSLRGG
jgi:hypothetical protein